MGAGPFYLRPTSGRGSGFHAHSDTTSARRIGSGMGAFLTHTASPLGYRPLTGPTQYPLGLPPYLDPTDCATVGLPPYTWTQPIPSAVALDSSQRAVNCRRRPNSKFNAVRSQLPAKCDVASVTLGAISRHARVVIMLPGRMVLQDISRIPEHKSALPRLRRSPSVAQVLQKKTPSSWVAY